LEDNIKMGIQAIGWKNVNLIDLAEEREDFFT
jgi:hypothetical protein